MVNTGRFKKEKVTNPGFQAILISWLYDVNLVPIKVFGVPLDAMDSPERVELKRAYIAAAASGRVNTPNYGDPYDALSSIHGDMFAGSPLEHCGPRMISATT